VKRSQAPLLALFLCATLAACTASVTPPGNAPLQLDARAMRANSATANVIVNPGFESGLTGWTQCAKLAVSLSKVAHSGKRSVLLGTIRAPEIDGTAGLCQTVTAPGSAQLTFWTKSIANVSTSGEYQQAQLLAGKKVLQTFYTIAATTKTWQKHSYDLSGYAGQVVTVEFDVRGNGRRGDYIGQYLDDVALTGTPIASPSPSPSPPPYASPSPSAPPSPSPSPSESPLASPPPCNDPQFVTYQTQFGAGTISSDQFVNVCGNVTRVFPSETTSSGLHGYFDITIAGANPNSIEIVSNLDAMAEAPSDRPPTWPWVAVNDYAYVQGRYYFDNTNSQGIDWTEDDASGSWPHTGYVAVCSSVGVGCLLYQ
jgi:hypothetical protein